jgi:hypothetical protein
VNQRPDAADNLLACADEDPVAGIVGLPEHEELVVEHTGSWRSRGAVGTVDHLAGRRAVGCSGRRPRNEDPVAGIVGFPEGEELVVEHAGGRRGLPVATG